MSRLSILKELCKEKGISINKLEQELDFAQGSLGKIDTNIPKADRLYALAQYFDVPMEIFFEGESAKRGARELQESLESMERIKSGFESEEEFKQFSDELEEFEKTQMTAKNIADMIVQISEDPDLYCIIEKVTKSPKDQRKRILKMLELLEI